MGPHFLGGEGDRKSQDYMCTLRDFDLFYRAKSFINFDYNAQLGRYFRRRSATVFIFPLTGDVVPG